MLDRRLSKITSSAIIPNWQLELSLPETDLLILRYLRQTVSHAWERSRFPASGPVHLNIPFRDPPGSETRKKSSIPRERVGRYRFLCGANAPRARYSSSNDFSRKLAVE